MAQTDGRTAAARPRGIGRPRSAGAMHSPTWRLPDFLRPESTIQNSLQEQTGPRTRTHAWPCLGERLAACWMICSVQIPVVSALLPSGCLGPSMASLSSGWRDGTCHSCHGALALVRCTTTQEPPFGSRSTRFSAPSARLGCWQPSAKLQDRGLEFREFISFAHAMYLM